MGSSLLAVAAVVACLGLPGEARASARPVRGYRPKIALDSRAIAKARRITVRLGDLPSRNSPFRWSINALWKPGLVNKTGPGLHCNGHVADLSSVTLKGGWSSRFDLVDGARIWELTSAVVVLATPKQARLSFDRTNAWTMRYCFVPGTTAGTDRFTSLRRVRPPSVADQQAEFLIRKVSSRVPGRKLGTVIVLLRRGPTFIELTFDWGRVPVPASLVETVVKKVAARAR